jgi:hypothetical protein
MMTNTQLMAMAAASICALSGSAFGQARGGGAPADEFDQPLNRERAATTRAERASQPQASTRLIMLQSDGQTRYELRVEDGETTARIDGREVPAERIRRTGDQVEILGRRGEVLTTFDLGGVEAGRVLAPRALRAPQASRALVAPAPPAPPQPPAVPPKVMLGITMAEPSESLLEQMDLDPGAAVLVASVIKGLPADKAGLKANDIIVRVEGKEPATRETVQRVLRRKEPGETVELTVLRKGESHTIKVTLAEYDQSQLSVDMPPNIFYHAPGADVGAAERMLREHMEKFRAEGGIVPPMEWKWEPGQGDVRLLAPGMRSAAETERLESRLKEIEAQLQRVNEQLARLQRQLERSREE